MRVLLLVSSLLLFVFVACGQNEGAGTASCRLNSDCPLPQICVAGECSVECREDRDCPADSTCVRGGCVGAGTTDTAQPDGADAASGDDGLPDAGETPDTTTTDADLDGVTVDAVTDTGPRPGGVGGLRGQVHFRMHDDARLPVSEPIVYWTLPENPPDALSTGASCDCGYPANAVRGGADGRFELADVPAGPVWLVVQKGMFRRVRLVEVAAASTIDAAWEVTELPVRNDPANGDTIPRIVIGTGRFDPIEDVFARLRLGPITPTFGFDYHAYAADPDAWGITLLKYQMPREVDDNGEEWDVPSFLEIFGDRDALARYHFVFAPCATNTDYHAALTSETYRANLRDYVNNGGRIYATDYSYDIVEQIWPEYISFRQPVRGLADADGHIGDPAFMGIATHSSRMYESHNRAHVFSLRAWLATLGASADGFVLTEGNWVNIASVGSGTQCCRDGSPVEVVPDVVMSGPNYHEPFIGEAGPTHDHWNDAEEDSMNFPHTVKFPFGCGAVMYSTYHTAEGFTRSAALVPQELVLLYLILDINECNLNPIKE